MERLHKFLLEVKKEMDNPDINRYDCSNKFYRSVIYVCGKYWNNRTYKDITNYLKKISGVKCTVGGCDRRTFEMFVDDIMIHYNKYHKRMVMNNE